MANDRWRGPDDAAWGARDAETDAPGAPAAPDESFETLRAERDTRAREAAEAQDRYLRTLAEFENFRRRTSRERDDWRRQAQETVLREILPALDNFDRALADRVLLEPHPQLLGQGFPPRPLNADLRVLLVQVPVRHDTDDRRLRLRGLQGACLQRRQALARPATQFSPRIVATCRPAQPACAHAARMRLELVSS